MTKKFDGALFLALLIPLFAIAPFVQNAGIPNLADAVIHLLRQVDFDHTLRAGALVPRWGADLYLGFGYPLYIFAPPLLAYLIELFHLAGLAMDSALNVCVVLVLELYSLGMFLFMRPKVGANGALVAAALNVYAPFRLRESLVTGGNYPQFLAMALFPLILWAFDGLIRTRARRYGVAATLSYAALILSHIFHALIFTPVVVGYVLLRLLSTRASRGAWLMALTAGALAVMLAAFFWLPALAERPFVRATEEAFTAASDFHQRFLTPTRLLAPPRPLDVAEANADVPLSLGWAQMAAGAIAVVGLIWRARSLRLVECIEPIFLGALSLVSLCLQLPVSAFVWDQSPILPLAEFPWRFMGLSAFTLAALGGYSISIMRRRRAAEIATTAFIFIAIMSAFPYIVSPRGFWQVGTPTAQMVLDYEQRTGARGLTTLNEYLPLTVQKLPDDWPAPLGQPKLDPNSLPAGSAIQSAHWSPRGESETIQLAQPATLRFRTFNYPGWIAYVDGQAIPIITQPDGTLSVAVPAGKHQVETRFETTTVRRVSEGISLLALALLVVVFVRTHAVKTVGDADEARLSGLHGLTLTFALLALLVLKIGVIDPQGWLRASRFTQPLVTFDNQIELLGGESDEQTITRGEDFHARFFWRTTQPLQKNYRVIAQLIATDGRAVAGSDKQHPGDPVVQGETPTTQIPPDKYLRDEHRIAIPVNIAPGRYELKVGLYDPETKTRLRLPSGETLFTVGGVEVK